MQCYTELIPPSAVTHAVSLPFLHPKANNLAVAKTSLLQIFAVKEIQPKQHNDSSSSQEADDAKSKLVLIGEYPLSGTITSLASIKTLNTKTGGDALLIAVADAKLSLVEWDPENYRISTISIHYYEGDNVIREPFGPSLSECGSILLVDPSSRCAALKFGSRHLAILPFRQVGDELLGEDGDEVELDVIALKRTQSSLLHEPTTATSTEEAKQTPYKASFVLPLTTLDPTLTHPVDLAFLHEYREPTFGILSSTLAPSIALLPSRKDIVSYTVFTLDLDQRASTNLLSVPKLPSDLWKVVPLPLPVGGALLVGENEFVHVDQNGKTNAVAVNEFARLGSAFAMVDQSFLALKLENCEVGALDDRTGDLLVVLNDASMLILSFKVSGRNVGGINVTRVAAAAENGSSILEAAPSCLAPLRNNGNAIFVGSEDGDSTLLAWRKPTTTASAAAAAALSRKRSHAQMLGQDTTTVAAAASAAEDDDDADADEMDDDDDDDLYAPAAAQQRTLSTSGGGDGPSTAAESAGSYNFEVLDSLPSLGPINSLCFGRSSTDANGKLEMVAGIGRGAAAGRLAFLSMGIGVEVLGERGFGGGGGRGARNAWSLWVKKMKGDDVVRGKGEGEEDGDGDGDQNADAETEDYDNLFFLYDGESTKAYEILPSNQDSAAAAAAATDNMPTYKERTNTDFEHEGETLSISTLAQGSRIVQCRHSELRIYEAADLALSQIIPMLDDSDETADVEELGIVHVSFCDPYVLVLREDSSVLVLRVDEGGDVEPLDSSFAFSSDEEGGDGGGGGDRGGVKEKRWLSGCLYAGELTQGKPAVFLLGEEGGLHVFGLPGLETVYAAPALSFLPAVLSQDSAQRRGGAKETLTELLVADLGIEGVARQPYLILRNSMNDLTLYEPFHSGDANNKTASAAWTVDLRFRKITLPQSQSRSPSETEPAPEETNVRPAPLSSIHIGGGRHALHIPASPPRLLIKDPHSPPHILPLQIPSQAQAIRTMIPLHHPGCERGFGLLSGGDGGTLTECKIPSGGDGGELCLASGWCVRKLEMVGGEEVRHVVFHEKRGMFVVATCVDVEFWFPEEDGRHGEQEDISLHPQVPQYTLHLLSAKTHNIIHSVSLPPLETITSLKNIPFEISEHTHEQRSLIVAGTAAQRGEDMPAKGAVNIFEILDVVPDPERAESGLKLHLLSREETRGAVTAVEGFAGGLVGTAQGQKIMVRGLKEDGSCLPVAFLDAQCHTVQLKSLGGTRMWLAADAWKGVWFGGFVEEPYKLSVLGKSRARMEVVVAEFLPFDGQLFLLVVDAEMDLHVLQYDPENPKSLSGTRLLHRSTFHLGHWPTSMTLLPSTLAPAAEQQPLTNGHTLDNGDAVAPSPPPPPSLFHVLVASQTGSISLLTPLDEATYRRLGALQAQLTSVLEHAAGLNPRAYRAVESEGFGARGIVDGSLVQRIGELGSARRAEVLGRAGTDRWLLKSDLEVVGGAGLGYL